MRNLRANLTRIALLALPGVVLTAGPVGATMHWLACLSRTDGLLLGTIVAATDPVAVLAIFCEVGAPRRLATIVTGVSLFNVGTALVLYGAVLTIALGQAVSPAITLEQFVLSVAGGLALGITVGVVGSAILSRIDEALLETTITLIMAYGGYLLAEQLGVSGPLETVAAGIFLGVSGRRVMSPTTRLEAGATWEFVDFLANSLRFLLVGLELRPVAEVTFRELGAGVIVPLVVVLVAIILARGRGGGSRGAHSHVARDCAPLTAPADRAAARLLAAGVGLGWVAGCGLTGRSAKPARGTLRAQPAHHPGLRRSALYLGGARLHHSPVALTPGGGQRDRWRGGCPALLGQTSGPGRGHTRGRDPAAGRRVRRPCRRDLAPALCRAP